VGLYITLSGQLTVLPDSIDGMLLLSTIAIPDTSEYCAGCVRWPWLRCHIIIAAPMMGAMMRDGDNDDADDDELREAARGRRDAAPRTNF
jgi:hypothetical protein